MPFQRWRDWRRGRILRRARIDAESWHEALAAVRGASHLGAADTERLRDLASLFLHGKSIEPARGLELTPSMRVRIACECCLPILNLGLELYDNWYAVIVYPDEFITRHEYMDDAGVVHAGPEVRAGEAWDRGPVVISWHDVAAGDLEGSVILHEMAHKLDQLDGTANGRPPLHAGMDARRWAEVFGAAYAVLEHAVARGEATAIDPYAAEDPGEFFAVVSEYFFVEPLLLQREYPRVYDELARYYRQDPARLNAPG